MGSSQRMADSSGRPGPVLCARAASPRAGTVRARGRRLATARSHPGPAAPRSARDVDEKDRKSTRLNSSHEWISYAVFCLKKKKKKKSINTQRHNYKTHPKTIT